MSIVAYTGLPGAGKSYSAVEQQILPMLKSGRIVCTNIPLKFDLIKRDIPGCDLREFPLQAIAIQPELMAEAVPPGALLVLDEVWRLFPSGMKANQVPEQFRAFFAEHRHRVDAKGNSTQIVLVTQDLAQIGAFARQLVENTFRTVKLSTLGIPLSNRYRVDMFAGPVSGPNPNTSSAIRQVFGRYNKRVWQYYVSHTQSQVTEEDVAPNEDGADQRANIFKRPIYMIIPVLAVAFAIFVYWKGGYLLHKYGKHPEADVPAKAGGRAPGTPSSGPSQSLFAGPVAKIEGAAPWRVIGTIEVVDHPERSYAVLSQANGVGRPATQRVRIDRCKVVADEPTQCFYDGFWYSESGRAVTGEEPVKIWTQKSPSVATLSHVLRPSVEPVAHSDSRSLAVENGYDDAVLTEDPVTHVVAFNRPGRARH